MFFMFFVEKGNKTSYVYSILKILFGIVIIIAGRVCSNALLMHIDNHTVYIITCIIIVIIYTYLLGNAFALIFHSVFEICEIFQSRYNKKKDKPKSSAKAYDIDRVINLLKNNDILDIKAFYCGKTIKLGASSDSDKIAFFDKRYYIGDKEYDSIEEFSQSLKLYCENGKLNVISIDDLDPEDFNF